MTDIADDLRQSHSKWGVDWHRNILSRLYKSTIGKLDIESKLCWVPHDDLIALHDVTETFAEGAFDDTEAEASGAIDNTGYFRKIPAIIQPYAITHANTGTLTFPETGLNHGGRATAAGTQNIQLSQMGSTTSMDMGTGAFGISFWVKNVGAGTYGILCKKNILASLNAGFDVLISGSSVICRLSDGTSETIMSKTLSGIDLTEDSWHSIIVNVPATGDMEVFADNTSQGTTARGLIGNVNNTRDAVVFGRDNNGTIVDEFVGDLSWLCWKKGEIFDATQRTAFHSGGLLDYDTASTTEVTTIPFLQSSVALPNSAVGGWYAG